MGKGKKPFIDKKNSSTYHILYRSQRDVADAIGQEDGAGNGTNPSTGVVLWPSPNNNKETDQKVLLGRTTNASAPAKTDSTLQGWKEQLSQAGFVDDYDYDKHMKPITGAGKFLDASGNHDASVFADPRSRTFVADELVKEVDRQLDSIALTGDCMDDDIAQALFGEFQEGDFEELNDDFVLDAAKEPDYDGGSDGDEERPFDFAAHVRGLMDKARLQSQNSLPADTDHEQGWSDKQFFARAKPLRATDEDEDDFAYIEEDEDAFALGGDSGVRHARADQHDLYPHRLHIDGRPGVVPKLGDAEEKALCDKFNETLAEYDSDEIGEGNDDADVVGPLPLEGDQYVEAALDDFLLEKKDEIFMQGTRGLVVNNQNGGSGFSALVGTRMVPAKELDESGLVHGDIRPVNEVLGEADAILEGSTAAPPAEEVVIDGRSYFSQSMRNPWDCESVLTTYSNLDNNPVTIASGTRRRRRQRKKESPSAPGDAGVGPGRQILLSNKTGLPLGTFPSRDGAGTDGYNDALGEATYVSVNKGEARKKKETTEEKRLRKLNVKKERQMARIQKKVMKETFHQEFSKRAYDVTVDDVGGKSVFRF